MNNIIKINDCEITVQEDGYIDATELCYYGDKKFSDWYRLKGTNELIEFFTKKLSTKENKNSLVKLGSQTPTLLHPLLAIQLALWVSPEIAFEVSILYTKFKNRELIPKDELTRNVEKIKQLEETILSNNKSLSDMSDKLTNIYEILSNNMLKIQSLEKENDLLKKRDRELIELTNKIINSSL